MKQDTNSGHNPHRHTFELLEIERILEQVADSCLSEAGSQLVLRANLLSDPPAIEASLDRIGWWKRILETDDPGAGLSFPSVSHYLDRLSVEGVLLEGEQLVAMARFVRSSATLLERLHRAEAGGNELAQLVSLDDALAAAAAQVLATLDADGAVVEKAVPELRALGDRLRRVQRTLQKTAQDLLNQESLRSAFAADVPTVKDGRVVLPVRANQRYRLGGVVYDVSQSGATAYVEPPEILEKNNELREIGAAYRAVVTRVYRDLSARLRAERHALEATIATFAVLDTAYAGARFSRTHNCTRPICDSHRVELRQARHPLLGRACVPMDLLIPGNKRVLIVTGPNTGGKTVSLKTMGVLAILLRLGMELPVGEESRLPIFDAIYADIGDEQSLQQSLSTFSGHMKNVGTILASADDRSLVLLDELGAGTDPEEGGALAMAVVDRLVERRCTAVITTHHSALKHYGYTHDSVENASVEFDLDRLQPTFRLLIGVPGSSHALHIARRHGLPHETVAAAEQYLGEQRSDAASIIEELSERSRRLRDDEAELQQRRRQAAADDESLQLREQELTERELALRREKQLEFDRFISEARRRLENLVRELREGELTRERTREVKQFLAELDAQREEQQQELRTQYERSHGGRSRRLPLREGVRVRVLGSKREGTALRRVRGDRWQIEIGSMRMTVDPEQLEVVGDAREYHASAAPQVDVDRSDVDIDTSESSAAVRFELDIRGMRLEEALAALRKQIEHATRAGVSDFSVIHGMGTGVLQQGVRSLLAEHPGAEFQFARPEDGGYGKTLVHLHLE